VNGTTSPGGAAWFSAAVVRTKVIGEVHRTGGGSPRDRSSRANHGGKRRFTLCCVHDMIIVYAQHHFAVAHRSQRLAQWR
jgi:hypothetical protein